MDVHQGGSAADETSGDRSGPTMASQEARASGSARNKSPQRQSSPSEGPGRSRRHSKPSIVDSLKPLSSQEALIRLHNDMEEEILAMKQEFAKRLLWSWLLESISFESELSKMRWPSVVFMTAHAIAHFIVAFILNIDNLATNWVGFQGFVLTIFLIFNLAVNLWDTKLRFKELLMKAEQVSGLISRCAKDRHLLKKWRHHNWKSASARSLFVPKSPCIHQTFTYRDESCLNLPDYLLVRGDIIHLFPGERAPGDCVSLTTLGYHEKQATKESASDGDERVTLKEDEIFHPGDQGGARKETVGSDSAQDDADGDKLCEDATSSHAKLKRAKRGMDFLMLSTPYVRSLRISLQRSHKRPVNSIEKECFIVSRKYFETYVIPLVFVLSTIVTAIHYGYLDLTDSDQEIKTISIAYLLLRPSLTIMPFLPWMFPCFWMAVNAYGSARLLCCAETQRKQSRHPEQGADWFDEQSPNWRNGRRMPPGAGSKSNHYGPTNSHFDNLLATPTAAGSSDQNRNEEDELHDLQNKIKFGAIFRVFIDLIMGRSGHVWRSSSLLQVLGCLTSLCCIDKVGILSWSNPTPEKLLVFAKNQNAVQHNGGGGGGGGGDPSREHLLDSRRASQSEDANSNGGQHELCKPEPGSGNQLHGAAGALLAGLVTETTSTRGSCRVSMSNIHAATLKHTISQHRAEILDLSQAFNTYRTFSELGPLQEETRLQFDDPNWTKFLHNLKPLGLAILMNNCCEKSFGDYFRFYKHISYESTLRCNLTPVIKRRCICALPKLIGFSRDAVKSYKYVNQIGVYRLIDPNAIKRGKLVPALEMTTRLKLPFPNMVCNIHQDTTTGSYQATSQGTADLILDSCAEFWNGKQLVSLDESIRKKAIDFYHRTSLTSYCSAFAYTPLSSDYKLARNYIEMPSESSKFSSSKLRKLVANESLDELFLQTKTVEPAPRTQGTSDSNGGSADKWCLAVSRDNLHSTSLSSAHDLSSSEFGQQRQFDPDLDMVRQDHQCQTKRVARRHLSVENLRTCLGDNGEAPADDKRGARHRSKSSRRRRILDEALEELKDQVFVGMVAMQYQACPDFVALVEQLEHACIRFVHFSKENELRSRVFSEKMGLESGWNCHISLQSDTELNDADKGGVSLLARPRSNLVPSVSSVERAEDAPVKPFSPTTRIANILNGALPTATTTTQSQSDQQAASSGCVSLAAADVESNFGSASTASETGTLNSWKSLPSLVMQVITKLAASSHRHHQRHNGSQQPEALLDLPKPNDRLTSTTSGEDADLVEGDDEMGAENGDSETKDDEGFDTLAFDMSNRAKLPKGLENIRPHLETVDNIPLQVSLFTDCTPESIKQMIEIMQDYGEIVCVIGSASSRLNTPVFLQANASIAVEPLTPKCCTQAKSTRDRGSLGGAGRKSRPRKRLTSRTHRRPVKAARADKADSQAAGGSRGGAKADRSLPPKPLNNPRDRLGIGPTASKFNEAFDSAQVDRSSPTPSSSSSNSQSSLSSSSSSSSATSASPSLSSRDNVSKLSQSLSDTDSSSSSSSDSSSCSSDHWETLDEDDKREPGQEPAAGAADVSIHELSKSLVHEIPDPNALAVKLASLPCSYHYNRREPVNLYSLIMEARHFTFKMKNTFVCMICFALSISSAQFLASILFLPPMLSSGLTIWLTVLVVPLMSFSLMSTTMDTQVMKIAVGKNLQLKPENITFFVICYLIKFIPSIIVVVLNFGLIIAHSCKLTGFGSSSLGPCWMFTYVRHGNSTSNHGETGEEDLLWSSHLLTAQVSAAFLMVLYFVVISSGFVHRSHLMWQRSPTRNRFWVIISLTLTVGQLLVNQFVLQVNLKSTKIPYEFLASLPLHIWLISFMWPILVIGINLLVKRAEIKATIRQQRRARFDFNTKLGMNSPF